MYNLNNIQDAKNVPYIYSKLVNRLMYDGKKTLAEKIMKNSIEIMKDGSDVDPYETLLSGVENASPFLEVRSIRLGGTKHFVPVPVKPERQVSLALKWIVESARAQSGNCMSEKLANEIVLASNDKGNAVKRCNELHKLAMANRAYSNFRWQ
ncbi:MAG: 30S ribosomal protein S7 [Chloroflexi bacterium]|nr:30S ribosomal protein S7 [Chloroflexota bacterium]